MQHLYQLAVFICAILSTHAIISNSVSLNKQQYPSVNFQLFWSGANSGCNNCTEFGGSYYNGSYACDYNNIGKWNDGSAIFPDLIPSGSVVTQVYLTVVGLFNCRYQPQGLSAFFQLNSGLIIDSPVQLPISPKGCLCPNCVTSTNIVSQYNAGGIGFYNYGNTNALSVIPVDNSTGICLAYINVTLFYTPATPVIGIYSPHGGPVSGSTLVSFFGDGFSSDVRYYCLFNGVKTNASVGDDGIILSCMSPPMVSGIANLTIEVAVSGEQIAVGTFEYYDESEIYSIVPDQAPCDGRNITVVGSGFFDLDKAFKCFWSISQPNIFGGILNSTAAWCATPVGITGIDNLQVSMNGQQSSNILPFTCSESPTPRPKFRVPGWAWILIYTCGIVLFGIIVFVIRKFIQRSKKQYIKMPKVVSDVGIQTKVFNILKSFPELRVISEDEIKWGDFFGEGGQGIIKKGFYEGKLVAAKTYRQSLNMDENLNNLIKEAALASSFKSKYIIHVYGICLQGDKLWLVMELMESSLKDVMDDLEYPQKLKAALDIAYGMEYLHHKVKPPVIHRDLKPENILWDKEGYKIADFGISRLLQSEEFTKESGTYNYMAPEVLSGAYSEKVDVYSYGVMLSVLYGKHPFGFDKIQMQWDIIKALQTATDPVLPENIPNELKELILSCIERDPKERPSFPQIITKLKKII